MGDENLIKVLHQGDLFHNDLHENKEIQEFHPYFNKHYFCNAAK